MFSNRQIKELFKTDLDSFFDTRLDDIFNYKKVAPITMKRREWGKVKKTGPTDKTLDIFNDDSCVALYQFENNANDTSGNYNGTWEGTEAYSDGKFGKAGSFDGDSSIVVDGLNIGDLNIATFSFWAKTNTTDNFKIMGSNNSNNDDFAIEFHNGTDANFYFRTNNKVAKIENVFKNDNNWHNYIITFTSNGYIMYRDKELVINNGIQPISKTSNEFSIGNVIDINNNNSFYNGLIDELRIFNKALNEDEINMLYNEKMIILVDKKILKNGLKASYKISNTYSNQKNISKNEIEDKYLNNTNKSTYQVDIYSNYKNYSFYQVGKIEIPPKRVIIKGFE